MSIKKTMTSLAVVAAVVVAAVVAGGMARADRHAPAAPAAPGAIVSHRATEDPQQVREYWTPERMRNARPAPMPRAGR